MPSQAGVNLSELLHPSGENDGCTVVCTEEHMQENVVHAIEKESQVVFTDNEHVGAMWILTRTR